MLLFAVFMVIFTLGVWLGYYDGSHREEQN